LQRLRAPVETTISEILISPSGSGPAGLVTRTTGYPALGKDPEFRSIAMDGVTRDQAVGVRRGLSSQVFSSIGQAYEVITLFADLAEFDKVRKERFAETAEIVQKLHEISREPLRQRVYEPLVSLQN
jgi:hypothetical protein